MLLLWLHLNTIWPTQGRIMFKGGHSRRVFDIPSSCAQGSLLNPVTL
jgi:hypothetical protein